MAKHSTGDGVKLNQAILDELRHQAERQATSRYKAVEVQCATLLSMISEIERARIVDLRFEKCPETLR